MNCRYCAKDLDRGDVLEVLKGHPLYKDHTDAEIMKFAKAYGWTPENKIHFSHAVTIQPDRDPQFDICPFCNGVEPLDTTKPKRIHKDTAKND